MGYELLLRFSNSIKAVNFSDGHINIGRSPENQIVINHPRVSQYHARITCEQSGKMVLEDLHSQNGVFVNGKKINKCGLAKNDRVKIATIEFQIQGLKTGQTTPPPPVRKSSMSFRPQPVASQVPRGIPLKKKNNTALIASLALGIPMVLLLLILAISQIGGAGKSWPQIHENVRKYLDQNTTLANDLGENQRALAEIQRTFEFLNNFQQGYLDVRNTYFEIKSNRLANIGMSIVTPSLKTNLDDVFDLIDNLYSVNLNVSEVIDVSRRLKNDIQNYGQEMNVTSLQNIKQDAITYDQSMNSLLGTLKPLKDKIVEIRSKTQTVVNAVESITGRSTIVSVVFFLNDFVQNFTRLERATVGLYTACESNNQKIRTLAKMIK